MILTVAVALAITAAVLGVGAVVTDVGPWYAGLNKPRWNPPNWAFGPAWTLILGLAAWAGILSWEHAGSSGDRARVLALFGVNIILHMLWSPLFFNLQRPDWALVEIPFLWLSILALIVGLAPLSALAAWLLLPYLLWVTFAGFLNLTIVRLNPRPR